MLHVGLNFITLLIRKMRATSVHELNLRRKLVMLLSRQVILANSGLKKKSFNSLTWPTQSPDLDSIEMLWVIHQHTGAALYRKMDKIPPMFSTRRCALTDFFPQSIIVLVYYCSLIWRLLLGSYLINKNNSKGSKHHCILCSILSAK